MCLQHLTIILQSFYNLLQPVSSRKLCAICSMRSALQQGQSFMESFGYSDDSGYEECGECDSEPRITTYNDLTSQG